MAFITPYEHNGFTFPEAYIKAIIENCDAQETKIKLLVYANLTCKTDGKDHIAELFKYFPSDLASWLGNPIEGVYNKLQASGEYPDATWNV